MAESLNVTMLSMSFGDTNWQKVIAFSSGGNQEVFEAEKVALNAALRGDGVEAKPLAAQYKAASIADADVAAQRFARYAEGVAFVMQNKLLEEPEGGNPLQTQTPAAALGISENFYRSQAETFVIAGIKENLKQQDPNKEDTELDKAAKREYYYGTKRQDALAAVKKAELEYAIAVVSGDDQTAAKDALEAACESCIEAHKLNKVNYGKLYNGAEAAGAAVTEAFAEQLQQKMRELDTIAKAKMTGLQLKGQGASGLQAGGGISPTAGAGKKSIRHDGPTPP